MNMKKVMTLVLAMALLVTVAVAGTVAWLMDTTDSVVNTFTTSDVDIDLAETTGTSYQMIPGETIVKDPAVTVYADSVECWVFVKVEESADFDEYMTYAMADGWEKLSGAEGVYYRSVADTDADQKFAVLKAETVDGKTYQLTVNSDITKSEMEALTEATYPKLTFTAYAIQKVGFDTAAAAWNEISKAG